MRTYLLPEKGTFYKANLHCHTTCSDGKLTPEEIKAIYKEKGYQIIAFTDHDHLRSQYHLTESDFLALTAYEISIRSDDSNIPHALRKVVDLNLFAKTPDNLTHIGYHPESVQWLVDEGKLTREKMDAIEYAGPLRDMHYYPGNVSQIIQTANESGFMVMVNHPMWSLMNYTDYGSFTGAWAVEVYNHACLVESGLPSSELVYEDILRSGKKIFAVASDDNHNHDPFDSAKNDSFGGFTMIKAESLDYSSVIDAMEKGHFYASTGPEIQELYYEDGKVHIHCSEVSEICMNTLGRLGDRVAAEEGKAITEASFDIHPKLFGYVRFRVTDKTGKTAYTNPYYVDEFMPGAIPQRAIL